MEIGYYLNELKNLIKEGWKFLFEDTQKIKAQHLVALLITIVVIYLLSYIISKIFKTVIKLVIMFALIWLLWMLLFDRSKYNELFTKKEISKPSENNDNE